MKNKLNRFSFGKSREEDHMKEYYLAEEADKVIEELEAEARKFKAKYFALIHKYVDYKLNLKKANERIAELEEIAIRQIVTVNATFNKTIEELKRKAVALDKLESRLDEDGLLLEHHKFRYAFQIKDRDGHALVGAKSLLEALEALPKEKE